MSAFATSDGTSAFAQMHAGLHEAFYQTGMHGLSLSSIGLGTYLGQPFTEVSMGYRQAIARALELGVNVFDSAVNYRWQQSEKDIGQALQTAFAGELTRREEVFVSSKAGFLPFHPSEFQARYVSTGICEPEDMVADSHCMAPGYLASQLAQSLENLELESLDLYYLHNPEIQLSLGSESFYARLEAAFGFLEQAVAEGRIKAYGLASWNGFRAAAEAKHPLNRVLGCARTVGGEKHHLRAIQLPLNLAMTEAWLFQNHVYKGKVATVLEVALAEEITVFTSRSIQQAQLGRHLPEWVEAVIPGLASDVQRALQFTRSVPGVTTALVGMARPEHVEENLGLALQPLLEASQLQGLLGKSGPGA